MMNGGGRLDRLNGCLSSDATNTITNTEVALFPENPVKYDKFSPSLDPDSDLERPEPLEHLNDRKGASALGQWNP